eukprot:TRINITY_DN7096_c0_g1_i1.p1 TRINITY_DN7096_c0_g1~~TRINITY_DN7096_c0_g1_i1.p1  ORF type:complete len:321 (+),score=104.04 TRINITY_DN7096_c0_g1_i1:47-1009(+)
MSYSTKTALVTGANTGLGFSTAKLLAGKGFKKVIISARTQKKADDAIQELITVHKCKNVFDTLILDTGDVSSAKAAVATLLKKEKLDWLILNAGATLSPIPGDDIEVQFRVHILGHHLLVQGLLAQNHINAGGRIVLVSSEVSLKTALPGFPSIMDPHQVAVDPKHKFNGDLVKTLEYVIKSDTHGADTMARYSTVKMLSNLWVFKMAQLVSDDIKVTAVSPGSVMGTSYVSSGETGFMMKAMRFMADTTLGFWMGMTQTPEDGAMNYINAADSDANGKFFCSPPGKLVGAAVDNTNLVLNDKPLVDAFWTALLKVVDSL